MSQSANRYEIRAVVENELEAFLAHMCSAFSLDIDQARPIYYNDPFFEISHKRILFDKSTNEIVSSLTIVPSAMRVSGGGLVSIAGIAGVCTSPAHRRKGFARRLLRETLQTAPSEFGYAVAALSTDTPEIYRSIGFEHCSTVVHWTAHRKLLPAASESSLGIETSFKESPDIIPEMQALYEHSQGSQPGVFLRNASRWNSIVEATNPHKVINWRYRGRLEGSIIYRIKEHRGDRVLEVLDLLATNASARRGLIGYLRTLNNIDLIIGQSRESDLRKLGIQDIPRFTSYRRQGVMLAIMDFDACLSAVASTGVMTPVIRRSESGLTIRLENCLSVKDRKPLRLFSVSTERLGVAIGMAPADEMSGDWISVDIGAIAQLFFGYRSATQLKAQDRLWISSDNALAIAESLFPNFDTMLGQLDAF